MNYKDFEQYNGKNLNDFIEVVNNGYLTTEGKIGDVMVKVRYEEDFPEADVRLMDGTLIGHAVEDDNCNYIFEASDHECT